MTPKKNSRQTDAFCNRKKNLVKQMHFENTASKFKESKAKSRQIGDIV